MNVRFKRLNDLAKVPTRGSEKAAGYDLYAATSYNIEIAPHKTIMVGTGLAFEIPDGYFGGLVARSGIATKRGLRVCQGLAVVDSDYRGEVFVPIHNDSDLPQILEAGERMAQLVIMPYLPVEFEEVKELDDTERGAGGFGSSGKF